MNKNKLLDYIFCLVNLVIDRQFLDLNVIEASFLKDIIVMHS